MTSQEFDNGLINCWYCRIGGFCAAGIVKCISFNITFMAVLIRGNNVLTSEIMWPNTTVVRIYIYI